MESLAISTWRDAELVGEGLAPAASSSAGVKREHAQSELLLDQLLGDDPLVATLTAAPELTASSGDESQSEPSSASTTTEGSAALDDEAGMSPLEIRRKRNRESMQRARQRQRDDIDSMKVTVRKMEAHFHALSEQKEQQRIRGGATDAEQVETQYRWLADASRRLKEEKFLLEKMLTEKTKTFRRLEQAVTDRSVELGLPKPGSQEAATLAASLTNEFFTPITEQQADAAIKRCYDDIVRLEQVSKPLRNTATPSATPLTIPPASTFGWQMLCHLLPEDNGFFVAFTKTFPHITPDEVMLKTWTLFSRPENNSGSEKGGGAGVMRLETLQVVNDNAYVALRDVQHPSLPDKTLRTVFLRFRLQTEQGGYVIGRACMNPTNAELRALEEREANVVYGDFSSWIEFRRPHDGVGCEVKFGAILAYDTQEDMQLRLINALMTTIMWETKTVQPVFSLQTDDDSALEN